MPLVSYRTPPDLAVAAAVRRAWLRYLADTRDVPQDDYEAVEERAWRQLASNLAALGEAPLPRR